MLKRLFEKYIPNKATLHSNKNLKIFGRFLDLHSIWQLNRHALCRAVAIGVFCAFLPIPFQMVVAAGFSIMFHANLPCAVALVWITNPITIPPIFFFCYKVGVYVLNIQPKMFKIELSANWLLSQMGEIWFPLLFGSLFCGILFATISYFLTKFIWRISIVKQWKKRTALRTRIEDIKRSPNL